MRSTSPAFLVTRAGTYRTVRLFMALLAMITAVQIGWPHLLGQAQSGVDYNIFVQVGNLARAGDLATAYDAIAFESYQAAQPGTFPFMPWTYPPQFNFLAAFLSLFPVGVGYLLFIGLCLTALLICLHRLAPDYAAQAVMLTLPAMLMCIRAGQNGFLTATLFALTFIFVLSARPLRAGTALGLLAYKPHLGLGIGLVALIRGGVRLWGTALLVVVVALSLATWAFGAEIWSYFLSAIRESGVFLRAAAYPMERMVSVYAFLISIGLPASAAMTGQAIMAAVALGLIIFTLLRRWSLRATLAVSLVAGLNVSPYAYDYDLVALSPALALILPTLARQSTRLERRALIAALILATGWGLLSVILARPLEAAAITLPSLGAPGLLFALALIIRLLARAEREDTRVAA